MPANQSKPHNPPPKPTSPELIQAESELTRLKSALAVKGDQLIQVIAELAERRDQSALTESRLELAKSRLQKVTEAQRRLDADTVDQTTYLKEQYKTAQTALKITSQQLTEATTERDRLANLNLNLEASIAKYTDVCTELTRDAKTMRGQYEQNRLLADQAKQQLERIEGAVREAIAKHDTTVFTLNADLEISTAKATGFRKSLRAEIADLETKLSRSRKNLLESEQSEAQRAKDLEYREAALIVKIQAFQTEKQEFDIKQRRFLANANLFD